MPQKVTDDKMTTDGSPNLDAMTEEDLYTFAHATRGVAPRTIARRMFGQERGAVRATKDLHHYAWNKITAMQCRLRGEVTTAVHYEAICDRIYDGLPAFARW